MEVFAFPYLHLLPELRGEVRARLGRRDRIRIACTQLRMYEEDAPPALHASVSAALAECHSTQRDLVNDVLRALDVERCYDISSVKLLSLTRVYAPPREWKATAQFLLKPSDILLYASQGSVGNMTHATIVDRYGSDGIESFPSHASIFCAVSALVNHIVIRLLYARGGLDWANKNLPVGELADLLLEEAYGPNWKEEIKITPMPALIDVSESSVEYSHLICNL